MTKTSPMNDRQAELLNAAQNALRQSREQRDLNVLLEGMAAGLEGKLIDADTEKRVFNLEIPDESSAEEPKA